MVLFKEISSLGKKEFIVHGLILLFYFLTMEFGLDETLDTENKNLIRFNFVTVPLIFYINTFWLIPVFLKTKKWVKYLISVIGIVLSIELIRTIIIVFFLEDPDRTLLINFLNTLTENNVVGAVIFGFIASFSYRFTRDWVINITVIEKLKTEKYVSDLAFLKSQVDPHFLFNTLNSLYSSALEENSPNTAEGIAKLGTLMRYNLHDSQTEKIPLSKEIDYIRKFIDLQKLRITNATKIHFSIDINNEDEHQIMIAPMLFIPIIENAFKYGVNPSKKSVIGIRFYRSEHQLVLEVQNDIVKQGTKDEPGGVGLKNLSNRLELLYPNKSELTETEENDMFFISLKINIS